MQPTISWTYEGKPVINATASVGSANSVDAMLLENVSVTTEGAYVCDAVNTVGITQKVFYVIVNGECLSVK